VRLSDDAKLPQPFESNHTFYRSDWQKLLAWLNNWFRLITRSFNDHDKRLDVVELQKKTSAIAEVEIDIGRARRGGSFLITFSGLSPALGSHVRVYQSSKSATGKGVQNDESQMDAVVATGLVISATQIRVQWSCPTFIRGKRKFIFSIEA
jgi:hypothetical protein